ncbi:MAG TPA: hypothetical protein VF676_01855 [Flavobacterium sp.]|jgi:hypothetical protein
MDIIKILAATVVATSLMTMCSYYFSEKFQELYKEPVLLKKILQRLKVNLSEGWQKAAGWLIHYSIGLLFIIAYNLIWTYTYLDPTWFCGIVFGIISGGIGIAGWMVIFRLPKDAPRIDFRGYYLQLFVVHIVFALAAVAVYKLWDIL